MKTKGLDSTVQSMGRRRFLASGTGALVALPFLGSLVFPRVAKAWTPVAGGPTKLFVMYTGHGQVMEQWTPTGNFNLGRILQPIDDAGFRDRLLVLGGIDQKVASGHAGNALSALTGVPHYQYGPNAWELSGGAASVDHVIARAIVDDGVPRRLDLSVTHNNNNRESDVFWAGHNDAIGTQSDPMTVFNDLFPGGSPPEPSTEPVPNLLDTRRKSVLDAVLPQFNRLRQRLSRDDQVRLDQHAEKIREIESELVLVTPPTPPPPSSNCEDVPPLGDTSQLEGVSMAQADLISHAIACNMTDVATLQFWDVDNPALFAFLNEPTLTDTFSRGENYHGSWHLYSDNRDDGGPAGTFSAIGAHRAQMFARIMTNLNRYDNGDGTTALDDTCLVWLNEYGHGGGHSADNLAIAVAGNFGGVDMGRFVSFTSGNPNSPYGGSENKGLQNLCVSLLHAFNIDQNEFGDYNNEAEPGPLELG